MSNYYVLLTDYGKSFIANAQAGTQLALTHVMLGDANNQPYLPESRINQTKLVNQVAKLQVASVKVVSATTAEVTAVVPSNVGGWNLHEVGVADSSGKLVYVGNFHGGYRPTLTEGAGGDMELIFTIKANNLATVVIEMDGNVVSATRGWVNERFQLLLRTLIPYGYLYHTHEPINPKPQFDELLGIDTQWRRIIGQTIVATDPNDKYINDIGIVLGQKGMTDLANAQRPNVYPLRSTHVFERYDPGTVVTTVWNVNADKSAVKEGDGVRFTVTANNLPDGQILNWTIKEGRLNADSNNITSPENTKTGTAILKNGQAVIDYVTTKDDNEIEEQKHVRLTIGAPADLSINVPISDLGHNEIVVHVNNSTTQGLDLAEYYKSQSGRYPLASDTVRFIVDKGVDIIAADTDSPALTEGLSWPKGAEVIVENHGRILGRGGDGGMGAVLMRDVRYDLRTDYTQAAVKGGNGGTAIRALVTAIMIENHSIIAGGGGGGGGGGAFAYDFDSVDKMMGHQNGTAAGGGAPLGRSSMNVGSAEWFLNDSRNPFVADMKSKIDLNNSNFHGISFTTESLNDSSLYVDSWGTSQTKVQITDLSVRIDFKGLPLIFPSDKRTFTTGEIYNLYQSQIDSDSAGNIFFQKVWSNSAYLRYNLSSISMKATDATTNSYGRGGYSVGAYSQEVGLYQATSKANLSLNRGGDGGAIGSNGRTFVITTVPIGVANNTLNFDISELKAERLSVLPPAAGGLAGYIFEGSVTINNLSGGTTKGR